jgi:hypothetical protein
LTIECRRADIRAFWIITTAVLALALGLVSDLLGARAPWAWGVASMGLLLPGLVWRPWFEMAVRAWNKGVRRCAVTLRAYVLKVGYYLLFAAVGRTGSSLDLVLRDPEISRWIPRTRHQSAFGDCDRLTAAPDGWWGRELLVSARRAGSGWQVCLLPVVLLLLAWREEGQESAVPSSTYTLY